jgi:hypothetical protein
MEPQDLMTVRPVLGQGGYIENDNATVIICPAGEDDCFCSKLMAKVKVKITDGPEDLLDQVMTQLQAYNANLTLLNQYRKLEQTYEHYPLEILQFIPATEADSTLLVNHDDHGVHTEASGSRNGLLKLMSVRKLTPEMIQDLDEDFLKSLGISTD